eukprot:TRINITY_DN1315_c0_g1_i1.p1 TRINITY_DN1315_c0_g1~~TRINITY_DN1315_c0_g1_i1.p1  ORF type:complete len:312 (+),score=24.15 TRINITY_DN1315_c0_g1_i1:59-937(+)
MLFLILLATVSCRELAVTREYTDYLKQRVPWEVVDYEDNIFRGWTIDEVKSILMEEVPDFGDPLPLAEADEHPPSSIMWAGKCIHGVKEQGACASCWAIATAGMLSDRCCLDKKEDFGWLSAQELISCESRSRGCKGGWPSWALHYVVSNRGLVPEKCYGYKGKSEVCPKKCSDGTTDFASSRVCNCNKPIRCVGKDNMKACLEKGPITATMYVDRFFLAYSNGIYSCTGPSLGLLSVTIVGVHEENSKCYWKARNSWGTGWGMEGYFRIECSACGIDGVYAMGNVACEKVG